MSSVGSVKSCCTSEGLGVGANFMTSYIANCKKANLHPLSYVKLTKLNLALELPVDQIKLDDWKPLLKSLYSDQTLHSLTVRSKQSANNYLEHVDTEAKVREMKKGSPLFTKFTMSLLMETLSKMFASSKALTTVQLNKLPIPSDLVEILAQGLSKSRSLQNFSIQHSSLTDDGVTYLCRAIRNRPNIITLELIDCGITSKGAEDIAKLIKFQELERFGESWKHSLRYRDIDNNILPGLRRITLNQNEMIKDDGLKLLIDVLIDDFWIKAIDMQECGISEVGAKWVLELAKKNNEIVVFDIRKNAVYDFQLLKSIILTLGQNSENDNGEYLWLEIDSLLPRSNSCTTVTTVNSKPSLEKRACSRPKTSHNVRQNNEFAFGRMSVQNLSQKPKVVRRSKTLPPGGQENTKDKDKKGSQPKKRVQQIQKCKSRSGSVDPQYKQNKKEKSNFGIGKGCGDNLELNNAQGEEEMNEIEILRNREKLIARLNQMRSHTLSCELPRVEEFEVIREKYSLKPFTVSRPDNLLALVGGESVLGLRRPLFGIDRRAPPLRPT